MTNTDKIRELNDAFRQDFSLGKAVMTSGVEALGVCAIAIAVRAVVEFSDFCDENDPHAEHDFGAFEVARETLFFKIDYYNKHHSAPSSDPADSSVTARVMTLMLAEEY